MLTIIPKFIKRHLKATTGFQLIHERCDMSEGLSTYMIVSVSIVSIVAVAVCRQYIKRRYNTI